MKPTSRFQLLALFGLVAVPSRGLAQRHVDLEAGIIEFYVEDRNSHGP